MLIECKFCFEPINPKELKINQPCKCTDCVHQKCLKLWQDNGGNRKYCEVCLGKYHNKPKSMTYRLKKCVFCFC